MMTPLAARCSVISWIRLSLGQEYRAVILGFCDTGKGMMLEIGPGLVVLSISLAIGICSVDRLGKCSRPENQGASRSLFLFPLLNLRLSYARYRARCQPSKR